MRACVRACVCGCVCVCACVCAHAAVKLTLLATDFFRSALELPAPPPRATFPFWDEELFAFPPFARPSGTSRSSPSAKRLATNVSCKCEREQRKKKKVNIYLFPEVAEFEKSFSVAKTAPGTFLQTLKTPHSYGFDSRMCTHTNKQTNTHKHIHDKRHGKMKSIN